jgi:DNA-binding NarL/FixJ family response regulator
MGHLQPRDDSMGGAAAMIRVLIVDDHPRTRAGLRALLSSAEDMQVVGTAADGAEAITQATRTRPDVVLMDASMPGLSGVKATDRLLERLPGVRVVMLASIADEKLLLEAIDAGAIGYLLKDADLQEMLSGVRAAAKGLAPISGKVARALFTPHLALVRLLTERERQVLSLLAAGLSNRQIADQLGIAEGTVKAHLTSTYKVIGVNDRIQAALWAHRNGLVRDGD